MQFVPFGSFLLRHPDKKYVLRKPLMLFRCPSCMRLRVILSKMALKPNFKNGGTNSVIRGLIYTVLLPSRTLKILLLSRPS